MKRFLHTPRLGRWGVGAGLALVIAGPLRAQAAGIPPLLDALSITVQADSAAVARGSMRYRAVRSGTDLELVASGIVVRRGLRVTAELRTDSLLGLRKYVAESRDSAGRVVDRVQVTSAGGRVTLERVTPTRRTVREYIATRDLMILDTTALVPFVALAGLAPQAAALSVLDVRRTTLTTVQLAQAAPVDLSVADVIVSGTPVTAAGLAGTLGWWRDARGRLLRVSWGSRTRVMRDDPPT